jgi:hypothetical protein
MKATYDLDRANPETARAAGVARHGSASSEVHQLTKDLRDQCRVEPVNAPGPGLSLEERVDRLVAGTLGPGQLVGQLLKRVEELEARVNPAPPDVAAPAEAEDRAPGERPCGCEDSQALQAQLAALRSRNFDLAMQLSRIRKLARSPDVEALFQEVDREP